MKEIKTDITVIGGGPAGLAAAVEAKKQGAEKVLIIERDPGILFDATDPDSGIAGLSSHTLSGLMNAPQEAIAFGISFA